MCLTCGNVASVTGADYVLMEKRKELKTYAGRVTPVKEFMADVATDLSGCRVSKLAADGYKDSEVQDFLDRANLRWPREFRSVGAGKDGGADVRSFQRLVLTRKLKLRASLALSTAIANSIIRRDPNGNPGLDKSKSKDGLTCYLRPSLPRAWPSRISTGCRGGPGTMQGGLKSNRYLPRDTRKQIDKDY